MDDFDRAFWRGFIRGIDKYLAKQQKDKTPASTTAEETTDAD